MRDLLSVYVASLGLLSVGLLGCPNDDVAPTDIGIDVSFETSDAGTPDVVQETSPDTGPETTEPDVPAEVQQPLICLLTNCEVDAHCNGCTQERNTCLVAENRCVACNPTTQEGCEAPLVCSPAGICTEPTQVCPVDAEGVPTVDCSKNSDCFACSPAYQVCDLADNKCKGCTATNTSHCLENQWCNEGECAAKCPKACFSDNDCQFCGSGDNMARACYAHKCSECSDTYPCAAGEICDNGTCIPPCGVADAPDPGACQSDADCLWCGGNLGDADSPNAWACDFPINGATYGQCKPNAAGCSDLGSGTALPPPYNEVTNTCSTDADCSGVGIQYNVGKLIRDTAGVEKVDLGITEVEIGDAYVEYGMPACASLELTDDISCGLCVPCRVDSDCAKIEVQPLLSDLFSDNALANLAGKLLLDLLYGDNEDQALHFQCQQVAAGYGACIPCSNPLQACGEAPLTPGSGTCDHQVCEEGTALDPTCGACAEAICAQDSYCCTTDWDSTCVGLVDSLCTTTCTGDSSCGHGPCTAGDPLAPECSPCTAAVCEADPYCCSASGTWDSFCIQLAEAESSCDAECAGGCAHSECETGAALTAECSACATAVCDVDDYCCTGEWDSFCTAEAASQSACSCQ